MQAKHNAASFEPKPAQSEKEPVSQLKVQKERPIPAEVQTKGKQIERANAKVPSPQQQLPSRQQRKRKAPRKWDKEKSKVLEVNKWKFPSQISEKDVSIREYFIQHLDDACISQSFTLQYPPESWEPRRKTKRRRRERLKKNNEENTDSWKENTDSRKDEFVTSDVFFNPCYLQYDTSCYGVLDQLVCKVRFERESTRAKNFDSHQELQKLPNLPRSFGKHSRVGPMFQARVSRSKNDYFDKLGETFQR